VRERHEPRATGERETEHIARLIVGEVPPLDACLPSCPGERQLTAGSEQEAARDEEARIVGSGEVVAGDEVDVEEELAGPQPRPDRTDRQRAGGGPIDREPRIDLVRGPSGQLVPLVGAIPFSLVTRALVSVVHRKPEAVPQPGSRAQLVAAQAGGADVL